MAFSASDRCPSFGHCWSLQALYYLLSYCAKRLLALHAEADKGPRKPLASDCCCPWGSRACSTGRVFSPPKLESLPRDRKNNINLVARAIRNVIRANRFARIIRNWDPYFYSASGRFARISRSSDSRESPDSRESCESIRANHATKNINFFSINFLESQSGRSQKFMLGKVLC